MKLPGVHADLPRISLCLLSTLIGLLCPIPCLVGILLCHASLVFHSLQVPLQLVDR
ncbi:MAG TPA: hypothetical protein VJT72_21080 [Pseudonocardiaceae bacterium]|nr:hypothetical protein [Pseudonocardiaceae bacterium]